MRWTILSITSVITSCAVDLCPNSAEVLAGINEDIKNTPALPRWADYFPPLPALNRRLRLASPCCGIHGSSFACEAMGVATESNNIWDLEDGYYGHLHHHLTEIGAQFFKLNLGPTKGDLLKLKLSKLELPVDGIVTGPPCPPWAGQGKHRCHKDPRAKVFLRILTWIYVLVKAGGLLFACIENVQGILDSHHRREATMTMILRALQLKLPEFAWRVDTLYLPDYMIPHTRTRVFLRGVRRTIVEMVPPPLAPFGTRLLRDVLGLRGGTTRSELTEAQQKNLADYEDRIIEMERNGTLKPEDLVCISVDRKEDGVFSASIYINVVATLTTKNSYLFILSVKDVIDRRPDAEREFMRRLTNCERLALQGFPPEVASWLTPAKCFRASGNAYPIPLLIAVLHPVLQAIGEKSDFNFLVWPPASMVSRMVPSGLTEFEKLVRATPKLLPKKSKKAQHKGRKRAYA